MPTDKTTAARIESLLNRFEVALLRLETLNSMTEEKQKARKEAQEAADRYIQRRKGELQGVDAFE